jgi:hypothetical protein
MTAKFFPVVLAATMTVFVAVPAGSQCAVERAPVRTATDSDAGKVSPVVFPAPIAQLRALTSVRPLPQDRRVAPVETTTYSVTATLVEYRKAADSTYELVLADEEGRTIRAELPPPSCSAGSRFASEIAMTRSIFESRFFAIESFRSALVPVEVRGLGFFDFTRGDRGASPNGVELQPVTWLTFSPIGAPKSPFASRKRAVGRGSGPATCERPTLTLTSSQRVACSGEPVTLTWLASEANATVSIDGIGGVLASSGSTTVGSTANTAYSGHATNGCGAGPETVAVVNIQSGASGSLSGPSSMQQGSSGTLSFTALDTTSWTLTSSLRNAITPSSGTSAGTFSSTYMASSSGTDTVTLVASGGGCGGFTRTLTIGINAPQNQGLLCCDGTRSASCFSCSNKSGCCSSHRGVCGC